VTNDICVEQPPTSSGHHYLLLDRHQTLFRTFYRASRL
jgi:hypothetical protein